jgi:hypothetical protein
MVADDATAGGQLSDDEKQAPERSTMSPAMLALIQSAPTAAPSKQQPPGLAAKDAADDDAAALLEAEMGWAKRLGKAAHRA